MHFGALRLLVFGSDLEGSTKPTWKENLVHQQVASFRGSLSSGIATSWISHGAGEPGDTKRWVESISSTTHLLAVDQSQGV